MIGISYGRSDFICRSSRESKNPTRGLIVAEEEEGRDHGEREDCDPSDWQFNEQAGDVFEAEERVAEEG